MQWMESVGFSKTILIKYCIQVTNHAWPLHNFVIADFTTHGWSHIYGLPCPFADSLEPMDWYYTLMFPSSSLKNTCLLLYATFNPILACINEFWPQTHVHRDVCINPTIFGDLSDLTFHYPFGALYKEPLGYIKVEELKRNETIVHCYHSLHILESGSRCPFGALCVLPKLEIACYIAIERWRIEVVEA